MAICLSHGGLATYASPSPSDEVLVGTVAGVFRIHRNNAEKWEVSERTLEGCHIHCLMIEPSSGLLFAGAHKGSLYVSKDSGKTWEHCDRGMTAKDVYCITRVEVDGKVKLYVGTEPARLFESDDLGETWTELSSLRSVPSASKWFFPPLRIDAHVKSVTVDPRDPRTLYACIEQGALLKSTDGGESWQELHGFDEDVHRVLICPSDSRLLFMATRAGVYRSQDAGENWEQITTEAMGIGYPDPLFIHPKREDLMFVAGAGSRPPNWLKTRTADAKIARSRDAGKSWEILRGGLPEQMRGNIEAMTMEMWDGQVSLFAGTLDGEIFHSDNEGDQWTKIVAGLPPISKAHHHLLIR
jgi:photosystem II stability/assembly factor-like uncharacterized protein